MTTGRRPTLPPDELVVTIDECAPVRPHQLDRDYFDRPADDPLAPRNVDRVMTEHERELVRLIGEGRRHAEALASELRAQIVDAVTIAREARSTATTAQADVRPAKEHAAKMASRWAWLLGVVASLTAAIAPVAWYAVKKLQAGAESRGAETERDRSRRDDHAMLLRHDSALGEIRGVLWTLNPVGSVRLQGAARGPAPDLVTP